MGNIVSRLSKDLSKGSAAKRASQKPRNVFEIAESVGYHEDVDEAIKNQPWAKAFFNSPAMLEPRTRQDMFVFLVCSCLLIKLENKDIDKIKHLLEVVRVKFFADEDTFTSSIPFKDINNAEQKIFRIYYEEGVDGHCLELKSQIVSLRQDKALRSSLEKPFNLFLENSHLHPVSDLQNCIMSIL